MIEIKKYSDLAAETRERLEFYIQLEFGHIPIVNETKWAVPDWTIINFIGDEIATFYNVVQREILVDDKILKGAGINNVITPGKFRGEGLATTTLSESENFLFDELDSDIGVLLCADSLVPFYERLNWYKINCPVYFDQPDGKKLWKANTMLLNRGAKFEPGKIDLQGLPW
jgi:hypothetical protein